MSDPYEFEVAKGNENKAVIILGSLVVVAVSVASAIFKNTSAIRSNQTQTRINELEGKWIKSKAEKEELKDLKRERERGFWKMKKM